MGHGARARQKQKREDREKFLASEAGQELIKQEVENQIRKIASEGSFKMINDARERAFARVVYPFINGYLTLTLEQLLDVLATQVERAKAFAQAFRCPAVLPEEIVEAMHIVLGEIQGAAERRKSPEWRPELERAIERACKLTLAKLYAQVDLCDPEAKPIQPPPAPDVPEACPKCGQTPGDQTGEYACEACGQPTMHDTSNKAEQAAPDISDRAIGGRPPLEGS